MSIERDTIEYIKRELTEVNIKVYSDSTLVMISGRNSNTEPKYPDRPNFNLIDYVSFTRDSLFGWPFCKPRFTDWRCNIRVDGEIVYIEHPNPSLVEELLEYRKELSDKETQERIKRIHEKVTAL